MKSMTGFGRAKLQKDSRIYEIEIKSVNYRYNDIGIKLPRSISYLEENIKKEVKKYINRGKIDIFISYENYSSQGKEIIVNHELVKKYLLEYNKIATENNLSLDIPVIEITKLPDILTLKTIQDDEDIIKKEVLDTLNIAINNIIEMRQKEGEKIKEDLKKRIKDVEAKVDEILKNSTGLIEEYIVKLNDKVKEMLKTDSIDETRILTEVVIYADKCSIEEEITRLNSHITQFKELINTKEPVGKKLDFLIQEMNRETNTIGSKSVKLEITNLVIDIKTQLEDIREQIQNVE